MENVKCIQSPEWSLKILHSNPISSPSSTICLISFFIHLQFTFSSFFSLACLAMSLAALNPTLSCSPGRLVPLHFSGWKDQVGQTDSLVCNTHLQKIQITLFYYFPIYLYIFYLFFFQICPNSLHTFEVRLTPYCLLSSLSLPTLFWTACVSVAACLALKCSLPLNVHEHIFCAKICLFSNKRESARCPKAKSYWVLLNSCFHLRYNDFHLLCAYSLQEPWPCLHISHPAKN